LLDLSRRTIEELVASGELPSLKIGKRRLVHPDDLREFIDARRGARS
jgi:excisionase family DNA binding protein